MFRCPALRIRDAGQWWCLPGPLKPSLAAVSLAIPGQTAPSRHHHCPAHFAAAPPPVPKPPEPFYEARFVGACLASERPALPAGRIPETLLVLQLVKSLGSCRELRSLSRAGPAPTRLNPTSPSFVERFGAGDNPEHRNLTPERVCVMPFRDPGGQDVRQGAPRDDETVSSPLNRRRDAPGWVVSKSPNRSGRRP